MISFVHVVIFYMKVFITLGHRIWKMLTAELCFHPNRTNKDTCCSTADAPAEGANRVSLSGEEAELREPQRSMGAGGCHGNGPANGGASPEERDWSESVRHPVM